MDSLKYTSFLGMISIGYMVGLSIILYICPPFPVAPSIDWWNPPGALTLVKNFGVFVFAFTCHQNMLPIQNEARRNGQRDMIRIIGMCVALAFSMYVIFACCNMALFGGKKIADNVIMMYPTSGAPFTLARFLYAFLVLFSVPLQTFPARNSTTKIISYSSPEFAQSYERPIYYISTSLIFAFCWIMACTGLNLNFLLRLVGSTAGPIICYVLPSLFWYRLEQGKPWSSLKGATVGLMVFGVLSMVISTTALFF
jgi:amino acid permease